MSPAKDHRPKKYLAVLFVFFLAPVPSLFCAEQGLFWGQVLDFQQRPVAAEVTAVFADSGAVFRLRPDSSGHFGQSGVPLGSFTVRVEAKGFKPYEGSGFVSEPASSLFLTVTLAPTSSQDQTSSAQVRPSVQNYSQTILSHARVDRLPTGNNIWNLVENLDLAATTNRIDVGGLWTGLPALFSGRGGCSWTQSIYLLNGMDVTDPYQTGQPLFYPDFFGWSYTRLVNADFPVQSFSPGAYFDLTSRPFSPGFHAGFSAYYADGSFSSNNITPALEKEGMFDSHSLRRLADFDLFVTGPLSKKVSFFASAVSQSITRDIAEFDRPDESSILGGTAGLRFQFDGQNTLRLLWTGQVLHHPTLGAGRDVDPAATLDARYAYNVLQALWDKRFSQTHSLKAGLGLVHGFLRSDFQADAAGPCRADLFLGNYAGSAPQAGRDTRLVLNAFVDAQAFLQGSASVHHLLQYGLKLQYAAASSEKEVADETRLYFFEGQPTQVARFNTPAQDREAAFHLNVYGQETLMLGGLASLTAGLNLGLSHGWVPGTAAAPRPGWEDVVPSQDGRVTWLNLSPRLALTFPLSARTLSAVRISAGRYYFTLPLNYLTYGNPGALGSLVYSWDDSNSDGQFQEGEAGTLLRREGPLFAAIDPDVKRPSVDELMVALSLDLGKQWVFSIAGFLRETRNLIAALNTGVPFADYDPVDLTESGDDMIPGSYDDLSFTVFNQKSETLGRDFFLLTNADSDTRVSRYRGADVTLVKPAGGRFDFYFSFQAIEAIGAGNPGNSEWENDDGVVGSLYADPNSLLNAKGRLRFDRGFTVRLGGSYELFWGIRVGAVVKYYDGQPFARKIIITGQNQGPYYILAHARGVARYEYNRTVDVRVEKVINLKGTRLRLILDGFNIFNRNLATEENEWTGPSFPLRYATEIQSPRLFRLGLTFEF